MWSAASRAEIESRQGANWEPKQQTKYQRKPPNAICTIQKVSIVESRTASVKRRCWRGEHHSENFLEDEAEAPGSKASANVAVQSVAWWRGSARLLGKP